MSRCCVISCLHKRGENRHKFFRFPPDRDLCQQWVEFCHCPETSERFNTGGPTALHNFAVCSQHFDRKAVAIAAYESGRLPKGTVPVNIGSTYMTAEMLVEHGFKLNIPEQENSPENAAAPEHVMATMFSADEMVHQLFEVEMLDEESEQSMEGDDKPSQSTQRVNEQAASQQSKKTNQSSTPSEPTSCLLCMVYKGQYGMAKLECKRLTKKIGINKETVTEFTTKVQKYSDLIAIQKSKLKRLRLKFAELKNPRKKRASTSDNDRETRECDTSEDEADFDESKAWW